MKDGLAGIFSRTDLLRRKSVGLERACRRTVPEAESAVEKAAVAEDAESIVDVVKRADGFERACRRTAPEAERASEKAAVAEDAESAVDGVGRTDGLERACRRMAPEAESAVDGVERADAAEDDARSFARGFSSCFGYLVRDKQQR